MNYYTFLIKKLEAKENIIKMKNIISNIDIFSKGIRSSISLLEDNEIKTEYIDERIILVVPCKEVGNLKELLYYSDLDRSIKNMNIESTMERGIIFDFSHPNTLEAKYAFNGILNIPNYNNEYTIKKLPKGKYLTLIYNNDTIYECKRKLLDYIKEKNIKVKEWLEIELFNNIFETKSYNCQIQVFIE